MSSTPYDPELPFLVELEEAVRAFAGRAEAPVAPPTQRPIPARRRRIASTPSARAVRRTAILVALLCLLGATAFGARAVFFTSAPSPVQPHQSRLVDLARGSAGADRWTLRLYTRGAQVCSELIVLGQQESSRCAPPPRGNAFTTTGLTSATYGYVFGITGPDVRAVDVRSGDVHSVVTTHSLGRGARLVGAPASTRYLIVILPRTIGRLRPQMALTPLDRDHRPTGRARTACFGEIGPLPCSG